MSDYDEDLRWLEANPAAIQELERNLWRIQTRDGRTAGHVVSGGPAGHRCRAIALDNAWMLPAVAPHVAAEQTVIRAAAYLLNEDLNPAAQPAGTR